MRYPGNAQASTLADEIRHRSTELREALAAPLEMWSPFRRNVNVLLIRRATSIGSPGSAPIGPALAAPVDPEGLGAWLPVLEIMGSVVLDVLQPQGDARRPVPQYFNDVARTTLLAAPP